MSRCFPFPPPGYEKKATIDDVDLLKQEKQKEKKHKKEKKDKEKKDKEKRENKEKKDKDRNDGKHKDKKEKKEKHREKKKEKDRDKEKDRSSNSEEKKFPGHPEGQNGEKTSDEKKLPGKSEAPRGEKFVQKEGRDKSQSSFAGEKKLAGQFSGYNGEKISQKSHLDEDFRDSKFVQELGRRIRDEGASLGNQLADKFTDPKRDEGMVRLMAKMANTVDKRSDGRKLDVQVTREETRSAGSAGSALDKARLEGIPIQVENNTERWGEGKEKTKDKGSDDKIRDKRKDKEREKKSHGKDKDRDKEKKKEEKLKAKGEHRNLEEDNLKGSNRDEPVVSINLKTAHAFKEGNMGAVIEENLRKRKDLEKNGFHHVNDVKSNKLLKTTSSHSLMDNGRTLGSCQAPFPPNSNSQGTGTNLKLDNKEGKLNGMIEDAEAGQIHDAYMKPPHPDSKYLSQVLSVPKVEEWSDFDDQEWLFRCNESQSRKPKVGISEIDETPQVWAEALQIESADVCALPYVIPY